MAYPNLVIGDDGLARCGWVGSDVEYMRYHDEEWGVPQPGDQFMFEKIALEGFQAGLSWITILRRRPGFRDAFHNFDIAKVANYTDADVDRLMNDERIIRNKAKINSVIKNARITQELIADNPGALYDLVWSHQPDVQNPTRKVMTDIPAVTAESEALSKTLRKLGFSFVGPTTMYALMQSEGLVDDHLVGCHKAQ
ncbi:DNA-3-methyladenine glycosylase I [Aurantimicrobium minutum]|uniref:DNA-3-methyladenine glycosylase I n=1 Tax=Aurantimicrobium minutum TaxID=708131 RepID=UPI002474FEA7|nr:DNA-3-methyladenine glycosylase I [Aurantimicrobium minutum]MDH6422937.1 DNA-3-methyladenine glycosylase I [Aurantimicrobium minutum]